MLLSRCTIPPSSYGLLHRSLPARSQRKLGLVEENSTDPGAAREPIACLWAPPSRLRACGSGRARRSLCARHAELALGRDAQSLPLRARLKFVVSPVVFRPSPSDSRDPACAPARRTTKGRRERG